MFENIDIYTDLLELEALGLTSEELDGYLAYFLLDTKDFKRSDNENFNIQ